MRILEIQERDMREIWSFDTGQGKRRHEINEIDEEEA
jgi:hypothetical protein